MALHRDIFWIGRQCAVTGHGMQLIDQRLEGAFDIEAIRLWDDDLVESLRAKAWLKAEDFEKGLTVARTRHSQPECRRFHGHLAVLQRGPQDATVLYTAEDVLGEAEVLQLRNADFVIVAAHDNWALMSSVDFKYETTLIGLHGSLTPREMNIPILRSLEASVAIHPEVRYVLEVQQLRRAIGRGDLRTAVVGGQHALS